MTDWEFRRARWDAYKLGLKHGKKNIAREDGLTPERFRKSYMDGYVKGAEQRKKKEINEE